VQEPSWCLISLSPGPPGSSGARVTSGVVVREVYGQSPFLVVLESIEEVIDHIRELCRHFLPLLRILFYVKQHHGFQRVHRRGAGRGAVVAGPGEPNVTAWENQSRPDLLKLRLKVLVLHLSISIFSTFQTERFLVSFYHSSSDTLKKTFHLQAQNMIRKHFFDKD